MKTSKYYVTLAAIVATTLFNSCSKDEETTPPPSEDLSGSNTMRIEITHKAGSVLLETGLMNYANANSDSFSVNIFKYYLSNFRFRKTDGTWYTVPSESSSSAGYYLVDESDPDSKELSIPNIPSGNYDAVEFMVGVDSTRNVSGAQTGSLDPANGMFWTWSSGYIFMKFEGASPQSTSPQNSLTFHVGGFTSPNNIKTFSPSFNGDIATVRNNISPELHLILDVKELFTTPNNIDFAVKSFAMSPAGASEIADNYADMFRVDHIHND